MSTTAHTPGPWKTDGFKVVSRDGYQICRVDLNGGANGFDSANADLIAAAPETAKERDGLKEEKEAQYLNLRRQKVRIERLEARNAELLEALNKADTLIYAVVNTDRAAELFGIEEMKKTHAQIEASITKARETMRSAAKVAAEGGTT